MNPIDQFAQSNFSTRQHPDDAGSLRRTSVEPISSALVKLVTQLDVLANEGRIDEMTVIFNEFFNGNSLRPTEDIYNLMIKGSNNGGKADEGREWFGKMQADKIPLSINTSNIIISGLVQLDLLDEALDFYHTLRSLGVNPDATTFDAIINGLYKSAANRGSADGNKG